MQTKQNFFTFCFILLSAYLGCAQNYDDLRKVTDSYAFTGATVETSPGNVIQNATIVVENGLIKSIGSSGSIPANARVVTLDSLYVYPGFISGASQVGIPKAEEAESSRGNRGSRNGRTVGNPSKERAGITPHKKAADVFSPKEKNVAALREQGFTVAHILPEGRMLPGKGTLVALGKGTANEMILIEETALFSQFKSASGVAPSTIIGVIAKWRDLYKTAQNQKRYSTTFKSSMRGKERPTTDVETAAFYPIIDKQQSVFFAAEKVLNIQRALQLQKELGFNIVLLETKQADLISSKLLQQNIPVFVSLELPKKEKEEKEKDDKEEEDEKSSLEKEMNAEKEKLKAKKAEAIKAYEAQAANLASKGVRFGFSTMEAKPKDFNANVGRLIEAGLTPTQTLKALTTDAAQLLGISNIVGTLEQGKLAHFTAFTKPFHEEKAQAKYVFIEGELYEYEVKEAKKKKEKKGDDDESDDTGSEGGVDISGEWDFTIDIPGQTVVGVLTITKDGDSFSGEMVTEDDPGEVEEIDPIEVDDTSVTFTMDIDNDGFALTLDYDLTVDGDSMEGTVDVGEFGSYDMEATRTSNPE